MRELILARKNQGWYDYLNSSYKFWKPKYLEEERLERCLRLGQAYAVLDDEGYDTRDDYYQGPFYKDNY